MANRRRITIVGGGPAGLVAATAAARLGFEVTLLEQASAERRPGGALFLHSNGQRSLNALGLLDRVTAVSRTIETLAIELADGTRISTFDYPLLRIPHNRGLVVMRGDLQTIVANAAVEAGVHIRFKHRCVQVSVADTSCTVHLEHGVSIESDVVILAGGAHASVRDAAGFPARKSHGGEGYLRGVVQGFDVRPIVREVWFPDGRRFGICPLPGRRTYFYCSVPIGTWDSVRRNPPASWANTWGPGSEAAALVLAVTDWSDLIYDEPHQVRLDSWHRGPLFVIGDAAHAMLPFIGQGANAAMVDGLVLARLLATAVDHRSSLDEIGVEYEAIRRPFVTRTQELSHRLGRIAADPHLRSRFAQAGSQRPRASSSSATSDILTTGYNPAEERYFDVLPARS